MVTVLLSPLGACAADFAAGSGRPEAAAGSFSSAAGGRSATRATGSPPNGVSVKRAMAALTKTDVTLPDIIISDLGMPDEDGYSLIRRIRNLPPESGGTIPAMALSAFTSMESKQKAFEAGFDKYCTKPFEPELLIKDISGLLEKSRSR